MNDIVQSVENHGYSILFVVILVRQLGLPIPEFPFLIAAGALAAGGKLRILAVIGLAVIACVLADLVWYEAGRRRGDEVLRFMHRFTRDPDSHDRRAKRIFTRYGLPLLMMAKFVPGLDAIAPPAAGIARSSRLRFLIFDGVGAGLYASLYAGSGYVFSHDLNRAAAYALHAGRSLLVLASVGLCIYVAHRLVRPRRPKPDSEQMQMEPDPVERGL